MGKPKHNSSFIIILGIFLFLYADLLYAKSLEENIVITEEATDYDSEVQPVQLEQNEIFRKQENNAVARQEKPKSKGKSILNLNSQANQHIEPQKLPKTVLEAKSLGWKEKKVTAPEPVSKLIKEVPKEIQAKKLKMQKQKAKAGNE